MMDDIDNTPPTPIKKPRAKASKAAEAFELPEVNFSDYDGVRSLHLGTPWIQGSMNMDDPFMLELEYVQRMMAWLLFVEPTSVVRRHAMQLGLGAASITKFCRKKLRMTVTAIELNPQVVIACRGWFKLPPDEPRQRVVLADAGVEIQNPMWHGTVDALQVDLYDQDAAAPVLDSEAFYADCRRLLTEDGAMTVNLFGLASSYPASLEKICAAFGADAVWTFKATREGNTVVLAQRTPNRPSKAVLTERAQTIFSRWDLPAPKWLRVFKQMG
jgi:spermidine synthase